MLRRVLDGYDRQTARRRFEVLVVVDSAEPDPAAVDEVAAGRPIRSAGPRGRPGLSANRNTGWRAAQAPIVLFTDNDTIPVPDVPPSTCDGTRATPRRRSRWSATSAGRPSSSSRRSCAGSTTGSSSTTRTSGAPRPGWGHLYGANVSIKRAFVERVGGFDEERLPYLYEDLDWAYRASSSGCGCSTTGARWWTTCAR